MLKQMYAIRDNVACFFNNPWMAQNQEHAQRLTADAVNKDPHSAMAEHASDFQLYQMGTYNDGDGSICTENCPRRICVLSDLTKGDTPQHDETVSGDS